MKINNISRRIIAGAMSGIALMSFSGCVSKNNNNNNDKAIIEQKDDISYDDLKNCYLVEINMGITQKLFICKRNLVDEKKNTISKVDENSIYQYVDVVSGDEIYNQKVLSGEKFDTLDVVDLIRANDNIDEYLKYFNLEKDYYTKEDIDELMGKIYQVYEYSGDNDVKYKIKQSVKKK